MWAVTSISTCITFHKETFFFFCWRQRADRCWEKLVFYTESLGAGTRQPPWNNLMPSIIHSVNQPSSPAAHHIQAPAERQIHSLGSLEINALSTRKQTFFKTALSVHFDLHTQTQFKVTESRFFGKLWPR